MILQLTILQLNSSSINDTSIKKYNIHQHLKRNYYILSSSNIGYVKRHDENLFYCLICDKYLAAHSLSSCRITSTSKSSFNEISESNENLNVQNNESLLLFEERIKEAEISFTFSKTYLVSLIAEKILLIQLQMRFLVCSNILEKILCITEHEN